MMVNSDLASETHKARRHRYVAPADRSTVQTAPSKGDELQNTNSRPRW
jgi:hypothetical protein